jgi:hypothetical protein
MLSVTISLLSEHAVPSPVNEVEERKQRMAYQRVMTGITIALLGMIIVGCTGPTPPTNVGRVDAGSSSSPTAALCGTWQGYFSYIGGEHTSSPGSSDLALQISGDSTYTLKWGNRRPSTGTVAARGKTRVILDDESGSQITLVHSGDTLYGVMKDRVTGRQTMMTLEKQESAPSQFAGTNPRC